MNDITIRTEICCNPICGVPFGIPDHVWQQARRLGEKRPFHCPNGHSQFYRETEDERLKGRVEFLERELASIRDSRDGLLRSVRYWRGMATRWKRKADR